MTTQAKVNTNTNKAAELRIGTWIDGAGNSTAPLSLADLGSGYKLIYCFQHWCPGCHSYGFPTLQLLVEKLADQNISFAVIQTVFEGAKINGLDKIRENQLKYKLNIPFGHDVPKEGESLPSFMQDYQTGGTPWFTLIDPDGNVVFSDFRLNEHFHL